MSLQKDALAYHENGRPGKIEVTPSKPCLTARDLALAYSPGVAEPCLEIARDPDLGFRYTARGNLVAVVTNGTRVLGLGDIGPVAAKPVMEGKGVLFKRFADIDVFDIEVGTKDPDEFIRVVKALEPTFGGINLEDIRSPDCFRIERELIEAMQIPVFHDDQHGTAIISAAALLNGLDVAGKRLEDARVVVVGAGAAGIACATLYLEVGIRPENLLMADSDGVLYRGRDRSITPEKVPFLRDTRARTIAEACAGADVLVGLTTKNVFTADMVRSLAPRPLVMALANPDPEIDPAVAREARPDAIIATGRSDYANQVNNVLGFPFIFRGALDVRARKINQAMKLAAVRALAGLAREEVPEVVVKAYGGKEFHFGPEYLIPKPFDPRVLLFVAPAVARAAMETGVAREPIADFDAYRARLEAILGRGHEVMRPVMMQARRAARKRIVFPEGEDTRILRAAEVLCDERVARPILLGRREAIAARARELDLTLSDVEVVDPALDPRAARYRDALFELRCRKGMTQGEAQETVRNHNYFGTMMVQQGDADGLVSGVAQAYSWTIRPALQILGLRAGYRRAAGLYMLILKDRTIFIGDATVNIDPTAEELAEIAIMSAEAAGRFIPAPRVAMVSFSNFGSAPNPSSEKVRRATEIVRARLPSLAIDGEMQADTALVGEIQREIFPFCRLGGEPANVLIFANLEAANAAYKCVQRLANAEAIGPFLLGLAKPVHVLQRAASVNEIVHMTAIAVTDAAARAAGT
ncbi:MAG TPA: NADP-dependent malic enzyme [Planctomycetota bacterium]|nr:NADP-dependent malic enzyme [Planctomycetota bacterium]